MARPPASMFKHTVHRRWHTRCSSLLSDRNAGHIEPPCCVHWSKRFHLGVGNLQCRSVVVGGFWIVILCIGVGSPMTRTVVVVGSRIVVTAGVGAATDDARTVVVVGGRVVVVRCWVGAATDDARTIVVAGGRVEGLLLGLKTPMMQEPSSTMAVAS